MPKAVRIQQNSDGTYSAYEYAECICTGTYNECQAELSYRNEYAVI